MTQSVTRPVAYPAIDGLRFYAALIVFLVHMIGSIAGEYFRVPEQSLNANSTDFVWGLLAYLAEGHHGVDVFFIISGFLMGRLLLAPKRFDYLRFVGNRIRRIYPAFLASMVVVTALKIWLFEWSFDLTNFLLNLVFANAIPGADVVPYNFVTWSLGYEFAFYLVVPALLIGRWITPAAAGGLVLAAAVALIPDQIIRAEALFVGAFIGCIKDNILTAIAKRTPIIPLLGAYIAINAMKSLGTLTYTQFHPWFLAITSLLFIAIVFGNNLLTRLFSLPLLRELGTVSYSLYLWHPICISLVFLAIPKMGAWPPTATGAVIYFVLSLMLSIWVSQLSYRAFEQRYFKTRQGASQSGGHATPTEEKAT